MGINWSNKIILSGIFLLFSVIIFSCSSSMEINEQYENDKELADSSLIAQLDSVYEKDEIVKDWEEFWNNTLDSGSDTTMAFISVPPGAKIILRNKKDITRLKVLVGLMNKLYHSQGIKLKIKYGEK